jgi:uncharacterized membrane protein YgcG
MSLYSTDYNSGSSNDNNSGSSNDGDFEERDSLKMGKYTMLSFVVDRLSEYTGQYGQQLIIEMNDVEVMDGIVMDRGPSDPDDDTKKVFGWETWFNVDENGQLTENVDENDVPSRHAESFGSNDFTYELEGAVKEGDDPIPLGNLEMWVNNQTKFRTFAKVVTPLGHAVVSDKDDDMEWLSTDKLEIRDDLQDRRIVMFFREESFTPDGQDEAVEYTDATILDADSGAPITISNSSSGSSGNGSSDDGGSSGGSVGGSSSGLPDGVPEAADEMIDFMARTDQTDPEEIETVIDSEVGDVSYDLEAVVAEIESRQ